MNSEMTSAAFVYRGNRSKMVEDLCLFCPDFLSTAFALSLLELGPIYFSDLKDVESWLNYNIFSNYENGKLLVQGLASWYSGARNNGMLTKILHGLPCQVTKTVSETT